MTKPTMLDYVHETPAVLRRQRESGCASHLAAVFCAGTYDTVRIVACGSSRNAAHIAQAYLRSMLACEVLITEPYTFSVYEHQLPDTEFCFVISQSGYSTNALDALDAMRAAGRTAIGVTGDVHSDFHAAADVLIDYGVGEEQVGYVTKGVASLVFFLWLFGIEVARRKGDLTVASQRKELDALAWTIEQFERVCDAVPAVLQARYKELSSMERAFLCGAGPNYGVAREGALKYAETLQFPAQPLELEEYLHGPNLQLDPTYTVFINAVGERVWRRAEQIIDATKLVTDHVFVLTDDPACTEADIHIGTLDKRQRHPALDVLLPLALLPFYQITAYQLTEDKHLWHKHPLVAAFDRALSGKSEHYVDKEVI